MKVVRLADLIDIEKTGEVPNFEMRVSISFVIISQCEAAS